jgi:SAM-dependent methyltransferase
MKQAAPLVDPPNSEPPRSHNCRFCGAGLCYAMVDLGTSPLCESFLTRDELDWPETFYPLRPLVCEKCFLVQLPAYVSPASIFEEYAYFSAFSDSWVEHCKRYVELAEARLGLNAQSLVIELASNDGYLLQHVLARGITALGIEPAKNIAAAAVERGVPTLVEFFDRGLADRLVSDGKSADLVVANNVLAQIPDLNDFLAGVVAVLKPAGVFTVEVPHLLRLLEGNEFDTIYHEHFSYFSLSTLIKIFAAAGLTVFDVEELSTHGGSIRIWAQRRDTGRHGSTRAVDRLLAVEMAAGLGSIDRYLAFGEQVARTKRELLSMLIAAKSANKRVVGYGAPGKGNTMLNYCGIRTDLLEYTVDRNPYKHGRFLPGTHIPVREPQVLFDDRPDFVLILPWNLREEIIPALVGIRSWGGQFVVAIPHLRVIP